jgi:outer membrane cobalamin receptor
MKIINFDKNFMPLCLTVLVTLTMSFANDVKAEDIEEVVVVAQQVETTEADPLTSTTIVESILPGFTWTAGGTGAFQGYNERGAQTVHTAVYKNGIPSNTPGSAWYDFGHEIVSGQSVKVISGANSVMYGSGSIAGTVLIEDTINRSVTAKLGSNSERYLSVAPTSWFQYTDYTTQQQARNDNTESDTYENQSAKIIADAGDFTFIVSATDYSYDYDNCYTASFSQSNDCLQDGEKSTISIRNEYFTIGRTEDKAEYYTEGVSTYQNESSRDYFRAGDTVDLSNLLQVTYGVDGSKDQYNEHEQDNYGAFLSINAEFALKYNFGFRVGNADQNALRLGIESGQFFMNVGTSFRRPNLYEVHGDSWVSANEDLLPEEGTGYEIGFGAISLFMYDFEEAIEYASGYTTTTVITPATYDDDGNLLTAEVTEDVYTPAAYYNTGSYSTQGFRFANTWGPVSVMLKVNDTDQVRIPEYVAVISWEQNYKGVDYRIKYSGQFDRAPGEYDFLPEGQEYLDDLKKLNIYVGKQFASGLNLNFTIDNVTDEEVEVLPFYNSQGREYRLALTYTW